MKKKTLIMVLAAALIVVASVGGTLAYLTSTTGTLVNTFTTGEIKNLKIDEALVDDNGHADGSDRFVPTTADPDQDFPLYPGAELDKDPTVTVGSGSVPCYVFVKLTSNLPNSIGSYTIDTTNWKEIDPTKHIYAYVNGTTTGAIVDASSGDEVLPAVFNGITVLTTWDGTSNIPADGVEITAQAYAHQAYVDGTANYDTAEDAAIALAW